MKPDIPTLKVIDKKKRLNWASEHKKLDLKQYCFHTNVEQHLTGLMGIVKVGSQMEATVPFVSDDDKVEVASCFGLVGPWNVPEGVKITSVAYVAFLKEHLEPWFKSKNLSLKRKTVFMHFNASSHAAKTTGIYQQKIALKNGRIMHGLASIFAGFEPHRKPLEHHHVAHATF